jgi:hypothetical protein
MNLRQYQIFVQPVRMAAIIGIRAIAAPAVIDKALNDIGAQWIIMDVIEKLHPVSIIFNQDAFIAALPPARREIDAHFENGLEKSGPYR